MRSLYSAALAALALALAGCLSDAKDPDAPPPGTGTGVPDVPVAGATFRAQFDPGSLIMPYPNDILGFLVNAGTDGTLNLIAQPLQPLAPLVNQLDGFSTNARIQANFTRRVEPASLHPGSVFLLEVAMDPATKAVVGLSDETICKVTIELAGTCAALGMPTVADSQGNPFLLQGVDYAVRVATDMDAGGQTIELKPLRPLNSNRANIFNEGTENGYLMFLTSGITDTSGNPAQADETYAQIRGGFLSGAIQLPPPGTGVPPGLSVEQLLGLFIAAHLAVADALNLPVANIVVSASFTTQDTTTVLETVAAMAEPGPSMIQQMLTPVPLGPIPAGTPVTTAMVLGLQGVDSSTIPGEGDVYAGALQVPYYLAPAVPPPPGTPGCTNVPVASLCIPWIAASESPLDGTSRVLNKFNPVPHKHVDMPVPVLVTIPNDNTDYAAALGGTAIKPPAGWPVVIFQHSITTNRLFTFFLTEPLNNAGYAVIAIDLPLHGIPQPEIDFDTITPEELGVILSDPARATALFRVPGVPERTFDLDLQNNVTRAPGPDGNIDTSGAHFINLANGLVSRDNSRQATADIITLIRSIPTMDIDGDSEPDFDGSRIHIIGMSLGAMFVTNALALDDTAVTASLGMPGGVISDLLLDSFSFGPIIEGGLMGAGLVPNTSLYNNFTRDFQSLLDSADPISHARRAAATVPIHFIQAEGDATIPNSASNRLAAEMKRSGLQDYDYDSAPELAPGIRAVIDPAGLTARVCFINGASHGSQVDPRDHRLTPPTPTPESLTVTGEIQAQQLVFAAGNPNFGLPGNGRTLLFGGSQSPLAPEVYGNFEENCDAPNRPRTNVN
jgi:pimeloyl-ACP methyl ester carboxylesterase